MKNNNPSIECSYRLNGDIVITLSDFCEDKFLSPEEKVFKEIFKRYSVYQLEKINEVLLDVIEEKRLVQRCE